MAKQYRQSRFGQHYALVDDNDVHALVIGAAGVGKTAYFLYPNLEYASAEQGNEYALYTLGKLYLYGKDVERDEEKVVKYLQHQQKKGIRLRRLF